jgi:hypothetical protein
MVKSSVNPHKFRWFWWWISDGYGWWRIYLVSYVILFGNRTLRRLGRRYFRWIGRRYFWGLGTSRQKLTLSIFGLWPSLSLIVYPSLSLLHPIQIGTVPSPATARAYPSLPWSPAPGRRCPAWPCFRWWAPLPTQMRSDSLLWLCVNIDEILVYNPNIDA